MSKSRCCKASSAISQILVHNLLHPQTSINPCSTLQEEVQSKDLTTTQNYDSTAVPSNPPMTLRNKNSRMSIISNPESSYQKMSLHKDDTSLNICEYGKKLIIYLFIGPSELCTPSLKQILLRVLQKIVPMNTNLKIRQLNGKVRALQNDLSQRTRNFLLHRGLKDVTIVSKADQYVQTDINYCETEPTASHLQRFSQAYESCYSSNQNQENTAVSKVNTSEFFFNQNQEISQNRHNVSEIIQQLKEWQRTSLQSNSEINNQENFSVQSNQPQLFDRQRRKLKREIKKLSQKLAFQQKISQIAKEALLISQEENYQFRLKIMQLTRSPSHQEFQIQIDSNHTHSCWIEALKHEIDNLEENLNHERQLRGQHLKNSLQLQEQINRLIHENDSLKMMITELQSKQACNLEVRTDYHSNDQQRSNQEILEKIKNTAYSISNCIPVTKQSQNINYFRPQTDEEILEILKRAQQYCKQIERWQYQRIESIAKQKRLFVDVLNKISLHIDKQTKENLQQQISKVQEMSHFLPAFRQKEQINSRICSRSLKDYPIQLQKMIPA